jgi:hypothetical protein
LFCIKLEPARQVHACVEDRDDSNIAIIERPKIDPVAACWHAEYTDTVDYTLRWGRSNASDGFLDGPE